jgi:D-alanine-D-alanine ligase
VIRIGEHDFRARVFEVWMTKGFDRTLCADGHEGRCLKDTVGRVALAKTRCTVRRSQAKAELTHVKIISVKKLRVGVIYGGRSGEHEVSVASAASIFRHLDPQRYAAVPIRIEKNGHWVLGGRVPDAISAADVVEPSGTEALQPVEASAAVSRGGLDVVFPVLHGPYGEDGTVQGLLELANIPYVGCGVLGSAVGMDKDVMKTLFAARGLPLVPHVTVKRHEWLDQPHVVADRAATLLQFPMFVKPANLGSSVGISKVKSAAEFTAAMELAFQFDRKVVIEAGVLNAREIECAVLGNDAPEASVPGEVIVTHPDGFYSYDAKYIDPDGASWKIPADISPEVADRVRGLSVEAFRALDLAGMARVDFFLDGKAGAFYLNEVNTIPGFTTISMYPKMWEASGLPYPDLLDRLIVLALERHAEKQALRTSIS